MSQAPSITSNGIQVRVVKFRWAKLLTQFFKMHCYACISMNSPGISDLVTSGDLYELKLRGTTALVESGKMTMCPSCDVRCDMFANEASENPKNFREFPSNLENFRHARWSTAYVTILLSLWI